jgi:type 1 fimbriae regulatory protein FimB/type 1 fimbriae regulatory protein FimE
MILIAYRHGLRAAELVDLRWDQVELGRNAVLHVRRVKNGTPSTHPLQGDEMRALRALMPEGRRNSPFIFVSERDAPFTTAGFAKMVARAGVAAGFKFAVHPHMLSMPAALPSPTGAMIPARCKPTWATRTSSTR